MPSYAYYALVVLTLLNLLNYVDRFIFAALIPYIKVDSYTDQQLGWVGAPSPSSTRSAPGIRVPRRSISRGRLIALGITIWSLATAGAGIAASFAQLLIARSAVGIGEANYATIAPGLLSDFFARHRRGMGMSIFFAAIPLGTAFGYLLGGHFGSPDQLGWRHTLYLVGLPGLLTAGAAYAMKEPARGAMDDAETSSGDHDPHLKPIGWVEGYRILFKNRGYLLACLGYAAITFALGALVFWAPEWLGADKGMTPEGHVVSVGAGVVALHGNAWRRDRILVTQARSRSLLLGLCGEFATRCPTNTGRAHVS
jgi:MFS family permease